MMLFVKNLIFTAVVPGTVAFYVPLYLSHDRVLTDGVWLIVGVIVIASGACLYVSCVWGFASLGRGTPAPIDAPRQLVIRGPYRFLRNPMYASVVLIILGWSVAFRSATLLIYAACVFLCFHIMAVAYEERRLQQLFGVAYDDYRARVGRWLPKFH